MNQLQRKSFFQDLPISIKLQIFSHLDVYALGRVAGVCHQWYSLANDAVLWELKLQRDAEHWQFIDHLSHPSLYKETITDLTPKELYLKCCPECHSYRRNQTSLKVRIPRLSFFLGFSTPRVVMFGPGLETETSGIVKRIFSGPNSPFFIKGMFPGQFDGIGSGVSLQYQGGKLDLITLYSACRSERENNALNGVRKNNFIIERSLDDHDVEDDSNIMVTQPVKDLCSTVDAFIYVVDATLNSNKVGIGKDELKAVVGNRWLQPKAPLLVLSCTTEASNKHYSPICVSDVLGLRELNRPWQVRVCHVNSLYGVLPGVQWLIQEVMKS